MRLRSEPTAAPRHNVGRRFLPKLWSHRAFVDGHQLPAQEETPLPPPPQQGLSAASVELNHLIGQSLLEKKKETQFDDLVSNVNSFTEVKDVVKYVC